MLRIFAWFMAIATVACKQNADLQNEQQSGLASLESYSGQGSLFITATFPQDTWIKVEENGVLVNKCRISPNTIIELSKAATRDLKTNHVLISLKNKTFSQPNQPRVSEGEPEIVDSPGGATTPASCNQFKDGSVEKALCGVSGSNSGASGFPLDSSSTGALPKTTNPSSSGSDEPTPCDLTEGYIWPDHWTGAVIEKKDLVFPAGYEPIRACFSPTPNETAFGFPRNGRKHAGCDLHAPVGSRSPFLAMQDGIIMDSYSFDSASGVRYGCATEVSFPSFFVRYSEHGCGKFRTGRVSAGEVIGHTDRLFGVRSDVDMLHIEFYKGTASGRLTQIGVGAYSRRSDLFNPTDILQNLYNDQKKDVNTK